MKMLKKNKKLIGLVSLIICSLILVIYINPIYLVRNKMLINNIEKVSNKKIITLEELIPFDFDAVYFFAPYSYKKDIEKEIGFKSRFIKDNYTDNLGTELIVVKNKKVISSVFIKIEKNGFIVEGLVYSNKMDKNDNVLFEVTKSDLGIFIRQKLNSYDDTFYDISFTMPGDWWEEDWEEEGNFYYVDSESSDNLIIKREDIFDKNKFMKYVKKESNSVQFKEILKINNYEGYHLVGKNDNIISHYISLNIKNKSYIFILNGKEDVVDDLYKELYKLLESIKINNEG